MGQWNRNPKRTNPMSKQSSSKHTCTKRAALGVSAAINVIVSSKRRLSPGMHTGRLSLLSFESLKYRSCCLNMLVLFATVNRKSPQMRAQNSRKKRLLRAGIHREWRITVNLKQFGFRVKANLSQYFLSQECGASSIMFSCTTATASGSAKPLFATMNTTHT